MERTECSDKIPASIFMIRACYFISSIIALMSILNVTHGNVLRQVDSEAADRYIRTACRLSNDMVYDLM